MARMFGTDGVRGVANKELTPLLAFNLGRAGAFVLSANADHAPKIVVGTDTRRSCGMLEAALVAGITSTGATAVCTGILPTPGVAYLTKKYGADAGVVISASHNSFEFNGIKFFSGAGYKLPDETEDRIEALITGKDTTEIPSPVGDGVGKVERIATAADDYLEFLLNTADFRLDGKKVVLDCANGASYNIAPRLFKALGAEVVVIANEPDGDNINRGVGSTHMEGLMAKVVEEKADVGFAFDGDADRLLAVDENGKLVDGDAVMAVLSLYLKEKGLLDKDTLVVTIMSNMGVKIFAEKNGIKIAETKVGDRYVLEEMLKSGYVLGGEQSGHVINLHDNTTGDGMLTAIKVSGAITHYGKSLGEIASIYHALPQVLVNAKVTNEKKYNYLEDNDIKAMCEEITNEFAGKGRVVIRPSGTEPLVRVMIEGEDKDYIKSRANALAALIEERLG